MRRTRSLGGALLALGLALLATAAAGHWSPLGEYPSVTPPSDGEDRFDPALPPLTRDFDSLYRAAEASAPRPFDEMQPDEVMQILFYRVSDRFTHGDATEYDLFSNWVMTLASLTYPEYRYIHGVEPLLRFGHSAICDQISYVLYRMAERAGIKGRQVALTGHVVFEAWYDGDWRLYDPDFEVVPRTDDGRILSVEALSRDAALVRWAYGERLASEPEVLDGLVEYYTTREDNTPWDYPPVWWQWEERIQALKFAVPAALAVIGGALLAATRRRGAPDAPAVTTTLAESSPGAR